ncbi:MAG TPA: hypothetical protein VKV80_06345 [Streptosporangiaceae bacterium]|nr:hypothetical protein [Streptosporangiaceae bacterium]
MLVLTGVSFGNEWILNRQPPDFRILLAGGVATVLLAGLEKVNASLAVGLAYIALVTVTLTRVGGKPSPAENLLRVSRL